MPPDVHTEVFEFLRNFAAKGEIRHGSIYAGSGFGQMSFKYLCKQIGIEAVHVNALVVEMVKWKQDWIIAHDKPRILCGNGSELQNESIYNIITGEMVELPQLDVADIGFSCKLFSILNTLFHRGAFDNAIANARGSSGETARFMISYIQKKPPRLVVIENVPGLAKGYTSEDPVTLKAVVNATSNLFLLIRSLIDAGYVATWKIIGPQPLVEASRQRTYMPCVHLPGWQGTSAHNKLCTYAENILDVMRANSSVAVTFDDMKWDQEHVDFDFWLRHSLARCGRAKCNNDKDFKWKRLHAQVYREQGFSWPPVLSEELLECCATMHIVRIQAEILHVWDAMEPMNTVCYDDAILELSLSINRVRPRHGQMQCLVPNSHAWWRRRKRWLLAPEAMTAQGYGPTVQAKRFSYRQVMDLMGNAFNSAQLLPAFVVALSMAAKAATWEANGIAADGEPRNGCSSKKPGG